MDTSTTQQDEAEIFRELVPLIRVRPELKQICRFGAQWAAEHDRESKGWAPFHIIAFGACLLDVGDMAGIPLKAGDAVVLPHGGPHTVRASPSAVGPTTVLRIQRRLHDEILVKTNVDGEPDTKIICGRLRFEQAHGNMMLLALPDVVLLSGTEGRDAVTLRRIIETIQAELEGDRLGAAVIAASLASTLMMFVLRAHFEKIGIREGILALLARRATGKALVNMLTEIGREWTLDELAARSNTSRATLVRSFRAAVNMAPLAYLSELRITLARHRIVATSTPIAVIAEDVGYQSETAFSRAYHRRFGVAPGKHRLRATNSPDKSRIEPN